MPKNKQSIDELVSQSIIDSEIPYELKQNSCWVKLESVCNYIQRGKSPKYVDFSNAIVVSQKCVQWSGFDLSVARNIDEATLEKYTEERFLRKNDILWNSTGTGTIGRLAIIESDLTTPTVADSHVTVIRVNPKLIDARYLFRWLSGPYIQSKLENSWSGSTNQIELNLTSVKNERLPLLPLNEQQRIVEKIERLLGKIDEAKRLIEEAKETFELRRAAIVEKAFNGEFTSNWRKSNIDNSIPKNPQISYRIPESWKWTTIGEVSEFVGSGSTPKGGKDVYQKKGIPFIRSQNVLANKMSITDIAHISEEIHEKMKRTQLQGNETLLNITGASIGRAAKLDSKLVPCNVNQHVCAIRFTDKFIDELPQYWLNSTFLQGIIRNTQIGATREALNFKQVRALPIPLIPIKEQYEILRRIKSFYKKEEKLLEIEEIFNKLEVLKQSILSKAFHGELGTNNLSDENAIDLLKSILQEQIN